MSDPLPPQQNKPRWTFIGVALFVLGLLIFIPSGLCTAVFGAFTLAEGDPSGILLILLFGGIPMAAGALLMWAGFKARSRE